MRITLTLVLLGLFALLGGQQSGSGAVDHPEQWDGGGHGAPAVRPYVAIGDSYTSGASIPPGRPGGCFHSPRSYPHRVSDRLGARLVDASCGGAFTANVVEPQPTDRGTHPPQGAALNRRTGLVTVSLGLNDAGFGHLIVRCLQVAGQEPTGAPCRASYQGPVGDQVLSRLPGVSRRVTRVLRLVTRRAPSATVVLVGYPQLLPESGTCSQAPFAQGDYAYVREFMGAMDTALRTAADRADVPFVSLLGPSRGHDVCAGPEAWTLGNEPSPRTEVWHPFANEHRAVAGLVLEVLAQRPDGDR